VEQVRILQKANKALVNYEGQNALHAYLETSWVELPIVKELCTHNTRLINKKFKGTKNPNVLFTLLDKVAR